MATGARVTDGDALVRFVTEVADGGEAADGARSRLEDRIGADATVDAAAVLANFFMMTRVADGTGTPLDAGSVAISEDLRAGLGLDDLASRRLVPVTDG